MVAVVRHPLQISEESERHMEAQRAAAVADKESAGPTIAQEKIKIKRQVLWEDAFNMLTHESGRRDEQSHA